MTIKKENGHKCTFIKVDQQNYLSINRSKLDHLKKILIQIKQIHNYCTQTCYLNYVKNIQLILLTHKCEQV